MAKTFDLIVLGTGTAGSSVAHRCRKAGWSVAILDGRAYGGTCALRGCEPKKTLWTVAEACDRARRLNKMGLAGGENISIDWPALMAFKATFTDPVPASHAKSYAEAGIEAFPEAGHFVGPNTIAAGSEILEAKHILIATGATPSTLSIEGVEHLKTSDDFLSLPVLPKRLIFLGGGYISFEFAHIAKRAGAEVTILHQDEHPLAQFERDLVAGVVAHSRKLGIDIVLGVKATRLVAQGASFKVESADGRAFEADLVVHGAGRVPNIGVLGLEKGNVATEKGKLKLDKHLRSTSNPSVFAAGDAAGRGAALTPIATHDAECVAHNLLEGCSHEPDYQGFASVVFTIPPMAMTGLTEKKARAQGYDVDVHGADMSAYQSVQREGQAEANTAYKVILDKKTGMILGAHLYGPEAHEAINLFALSIRLGLKADQLGKLMSAYPSAASNIAGML